MWICLCDCCLKLVWLYLCWMCLYMHISVFLYILASIYTCVCLSLCFQYHSESVYVYQPNQPSLCYSVSYYNCLFICNFCLSVSVYLGLFLSICTCFFLCLPVYVYQSIIGCLSVFVHFYLYIPIYNFLLQVALCLYIKG